VPHEVGDVRAQSPRGSATPFVTGPHVPFAPPVRAAEQAWHAPVHELLQQKPSMHDPLAH
jgi:hypothetical protein